MEKNSQNKPASSNRRTLLKALATVPVLGALGWGALKKYNDDTNTKTTLVNALGLDYHPPVRESSPVKSINSGDPIRLGIIGAGGRGRSLVQAAGFAHPTTIDKWREGNEKDPKDQRLADFLNQDDLNVVFNGVCDVFDVHAQLALEAASNPKKLGTKEQKAITIKRYKTYQELLAAPDIDAVIIATPDHWHAPIAIDAIKAGKHVYVEKPMTWTPEETYKLREAVKQSNKILQVGHQGRQTDSYLKAREIIEKNILGKISLIEVCTNRNSPNGAWVYDINPKASAETIDWNQFLGRAPKIPFNLERFFRWRCWWDYGTGLSGDLLTHEFDAINQVMDMGIPHSCVASGGTYFYKDGRDVPDVFQAVYEYPEREFSFIYSATLSSDRDRGKIIMGHDGSMNMGHDLTVNIDQESTRYKQLIDDKIIDPSVPAFVYSAGSGSIDAVTSPTAKYFASRGLLYTYRNGKRTDTSTLHIKEWLDCIRTGAQPSCNVDQGFMGAMTAHMATMSYREGIKVYWDKDKELIVRGERVKI